VGVDVGQLSRGAGTAEGARTASPIADPQDGPGARCDPFSELKRCPDVRTDFFHTTLFPDAKFITFSNSLFVMGVPRNRPHRPDDPNKIFRFLEPGWRTPGGRSISRAPREKKLSSAPRTATRWGGASARAANRRRGTEGSLQTLRGGSRRACGSAPVQGRACTSARQEVRDPPLPTARFEQILERTAFWPSGDGSTPSNKVTWAEPPRAPGRPLRCVVSMLGRGLRRAKILRVHESAASTRQIETARSWPARGIGAVDARIALPAGHPSRWAPLHGGRPAFTSLGTRGARRGSPQQHRSAGPGAPPIPWAHLGLRKERRGRSGNHAPQPFSRPRAPQGEEPRCTILLDPPAETLSRHGTKQAGAPRDRVAVLVRTGPDLGRRPRFSARRARERLSTRAARSCCSGSVDIHPQLRRAGQPGTR